MWMTCAILSGCALTPPPRPLSNDAPDNPDAPSSPGAPLYPTMNLVKKAAP